MPQGKQIQHVFFGVSGWHLGVGIQPAPQGQSPPQDSCIPVQLGTRSCCGRFSSLFLEGRLWVSFTVCQCQMTCLQRTADLFYPVAPTQKASPS